MRAVILSIGILFLGVPRLSAQDVIDFSDLFSWVGPLVLEDLPDALNVTPLPRPDPLGGWIVVDPREGQVRIYGQAGEHRFHFGRRGRGPGEFADLVSAFRLPTDSMVSFDSSGRITVWSPDGSDNARDFETRIRAVQAAEPLTATTLVMVAAPQITDPADLRQPVLHLIDLEAGKIARSFFRPPITLEEAPAWVTIAGATLAVWDGRLYATLPLSDTIYAFAPPYDLPVLRIPVRSRHLAGRRPIPDGTQDRAAFNDWVRSVWFLGSTFPAGPDHFLVTLYAFGQDPKLLYVPREGGEALDVVAAPALLAYDSQRAEYVFRAPERLEPNQLARASLRRR